MAVALEKCFDVGEVDFLSPLLLLKSVCNITNLLVLPSLPHSPPLQIAIDTVLFFIGFCSALQLLSNPQLILSPNRCYLPSVPQHLSVESQHLRPTGSHLFMALGSLWPRLLPLHAPLLLDLSPWLLPGIQPRQTLSVRRLHLSWAFLHLPCRLTGRSLLSGLPPL